MFTKLHDRPIPNVGVRVRVGVGPVEFQLYNTITICWRRMSHIVVRGLGQPIGWVGFDCVGSRCFDF